jgi:hypothetical protein
MLIDSEEFGNLMGNWTEMINLLPFLNSREADETFEHDGKQIATNLPKNFHLVDPLLPLFPTESFLLVIQQMLSLIVNPPEVGFIVPAFWAMIGRSRK